MNPMAAFLRAFWLYGIPDFGAIDMHIAECSDWAVIFCILSQMVWFLLEPIQDVCLLGPKAKVQDLAFR